MTIVNTALRALFDLILMPLEGFSPWIGLAFVSLVSAIAALLVYKKVSNQPAIERVKNSMQASLFEIRLYNDDLRAILKAQTRFLVGNLRYLGLNLVPLLWMIVPFVLVFVHLEPRYRHTGLEPEGLALVKAQLIGAEVRGGAAPVKPDMTLDLPDGVVADSPGVWLPAEREMAWRLRANEPGCYELSIRRAGETYKKEIRFSDRVEVFSDGRPVKGFLGQLARPAEKPLPVESGLGAIVVIYPERGWGTVPFSDLSIAWWFWWLVLMVVFGLALRGPMGVQI